MAPRSLRSLIDEKVGDDLVAIGARFLEEITVDEGRKVVCFFATTNTTFEIEESYHDGLGCKVERYTDTGNRQDFESWATLWELNSSKPNLPLDEQIRRDLLPNSPEQLWLHLGRALRIYFVPDPQAADCPPLRG